MYRNILLPVDLTDKNNLAVEAAREVLDTVGGSVTLLHVVETLDLPFEEMQDFYEQLADSASGKMETIVAERLQGCNAKHETAFGRRVRSILTFATENDIDLIVMTSHRMTPADERSSLMSISHQVAIFGPCSVMLLR